MTITATIRKAGPFSGSGTTGPFTFEFKVFADADVYCVKTNTTTDAEEVLALTTDYTVSLNSNQNTNPGGTVTLVSALAVGYNLTITSSLGYTQPVVLTALGGFYPEVINDALDRSTIQIQQLAEQVSRAAKVPISSASDADALSEAILLVAENWDTLGDLLDSMAQLYAGNLESLAGLTGSADKVPYFTALETLSLSTLTTFGRSLIAAANSSAARTVLGISEPDLIPTGGKIPFCGITAPSGWVLASGETIGDASSGGTERANADTEDLFNLLWASYSDTNLPIFTSAGDASTRGASAAADWADHKRMTVPDMRGRTSIGLDNLGGTSANRVTAEVADTLGGSGGEETHVLTEAELDAHGHLYSMHSHGQVGRSDGGEPTAGSSTAGSATSSDTGSSTAHNNMPPYVADTWIIKL